MKGVLVEKAGGEIKVVDDLMKPSPGPDQLLVRPIYVAMQPVYAHSVFPNLNTDGKQRLAHDLVWPSRGGMAIGSGF
jgi:hypothetical protein